MSHVDSAAAAGDDDFRADGQHEQHIEVETDLHQRVVDCDNALGTGKVAADVLRGVAELLLFVFLTGKALDHTHGPDVFLHRTVEIVVLLKYAVKGGHSFFGDNQQSHDQHGNDHNKRSGQRTTHDIRHDDRE